jgi:uncharacterized protein (UPF0548 family)
MWNIRKPSELDLQKFGAVETLNSLAYNAVGVTREWEVGKRPVNVPEGFVCDQNVVVLGQGKLCYEAAVQALSDWRMFPRWAQVRCATGAPVGAVVVLLFSLAGLYWRSAGRIIYRVDEVDEAEVAGARARWGFAYGTLPGHVECGEERFTVAWRHDDTVVYELQAFSRPRFWMARLAAPLARCWQRKFVVDSQEKMIDEITRILD